MTNKSHQTVKRARTEKSGYAFDYVPALYVLGIIFVPSRTNIIRLRGAALHLGG